MLSRASKRNFDEVITDSDILDQAANFENEFRYGKRKYIPLVLDESNPTPSNHPITPQIPILANTSPLQPTVQILTTSSGTETADITDRGTRLVHPDVAVQTVDVNVPLSSNREAQTQTERTRVPRIPTVRYHPSIVNSIRRNYCILPKRRRRRRRKRTVNTASRRMIPSVVYHPSILPGRLSGLRIPKVAYHPSITP